MANESELVEVARRNLAAAFRWAARLNFNEATANHFSLATSSDGQEFLMNPCGRHFANIRASDLLHLSVQNTYDTNNYVDATAWILHGQIHRLVQRAKCILHTHMPFTTALTCLKDFEFLMLDQNACRFHNLIAYDRNYSGMALATSEGERVAQILGESKQILFLGNHGVIVVGNTVAEAFDALYYLERAAQLQVLALSTGKPLRIIDEHTAAMVAKQWLEYPQHQERHFAELIEILDRESPEYQS